MAKSYESVNRSIYSINNKMSLISFTDPTNSIQNIQSDLNEIEKNWNTSGGEKKVAEMKKIINNISSSCSTLKGNIEQRKKWRYKASKVTDK